MIMIFCVRCKNGVCPRHVTFFLSLLKYKHVPFLHLVIQVRVIVRVRVLLAGRFVRNLFRRCTPRPRSPPCETTSTIPLAKSLCSLIIIVNSKRTWRTSLPDLKTYLHDVSIQNRTFSSCVSIWIGRQGCWSQTHGVSTCQRFEDESKLWKVIRFETHHHNVVAVLLLLRQCCYVSGEQIKRINRILIAVLEYTAFRQSWTWSKLCGASHRALYCYCYCWSTCIFVFYAARDGIARVRQMCALIVDKFSVRPVHKILRSHGEIIYGRAKQDVHRNTGCRVVRG
jgi:hypothetical protein